ncbi:helix-turn-helix domain-containing protein [Desulfohalovibrio reitneri]|uniref:helix-turn-helix domain-containing protein n=1 Tax=Desulfohalovibrio reitneri TaxID=1307759 RepID=UPI0004A6EB62|nr:helix-turn-helix domain-containing protein [Desulfohalovibrio reitneri]
MAILLVGKEQIAKALGVGKNTIPRLVREEGLPAWREGSRGIYRALPDDLTTWLKQRRRQYKGDC